MPAADLVQLLQHAEVKPQAEWGRPAESIVDGARLVHD